MADFKVYAPKLLQLEGGYSNHTEDKGSHTMMGVTLATYRAYGRRAKRVTKFFHNLNGFKVGRTKYADFDKFAFFKRFVDACDLVFTQTALAYLENRLYSTCHTAQSRALFTVHLY